VTRLVPQKGVHLIRHSIYRTLEKGGQFVLLGSSPVPQIQVCLLMDHLSFMPSVGSDYVWTGWLLHHFLG
jgi:hypothetical protein